MGNNFKKGDKVSNEIVILVSVLVVLLVFVLYGCKLSCGDRRKRRLQEGFWRTEIANDTAGTGGFYQTPVNFANSYPNVTWQDSPHYKANPENKYQPLEYGPVDTEAAVRRLSANWEEDPHSNQPPIWDEFSQYYTGKRATDNAGNVLAGQPFMANALKPRFTLTSLGETFSSDLLADQVQYGHTHDVGETYEQRLELRKRNQLQFPSNTSLSLAKYVRANLDKKL